jgi:predicted cobalt transporter CbtA
MVVSFTLLVTCLSSVATVARMKRQGLFHVVASCAAVHWPEKNNRG